MTPDSASDLVAKLGEAASPRPYVLDGFNLLDAGTWMIAVMARAGNPSTKSSPEATKAYTALAVNSFELVLKALEAGKEARLATGRQSTCAKQVHGDSHIQCGKCFICLERKALATVRDAAQKALA